MKRIVHIALSQHWPQAWPPARRRNRRRANSRSSAPSRSPRSPPWRAVDLTRRTVKLRSLDGQPFVVRVGKEAVSLPQVKKGDQVEVTYARELEVTLADPGEVVNETDVVVDRAQPGSKPEGSAIAQTRVTATILDLDKEREGHAENGEGQARWPRSRCRTRPGPDKVKVGDTILIRYLEAVDITVKGKKR